MYCLSSRYKREPNFQAALCHRSLHSPIMDSIMKRLLKRCIRDECQKLIERHYEYLFDLEESTRRKERRLGAPAAKTILRPHYWCIHHGFDPFRVRSTKLLNTYAHTLSAKLRTLTYEPQPSIIYTIPKSSGGIRELNVFQIPDAAISRFVYKLSTAKKFTHPTAKQFTHPWRAGRIDVSSGRPPWQAKSFGRVLTKVDNYGPPAPDGGSD